MPLHRRFTARNALAALLIWLALALLFHLRSELFSSEPSTSPLDIDPNPEYEPPPHTNSGQDEQNSAPFGGKHFSDGGNEPLLEGLSASPTQGEGNGTGGIKKTTIVVASQKDEDSTWLDEYFPQWEKAVYMVDVEPKTKGASGVLTVPKNKGRESMVYLTHIIDNYDRLPDNILFIHPARYQWHNDDPDYDGLPMLRHFQFPYLASEGYVNIRCAWSLGCPSEIKPLEEEGEHRQAVHAGGDYKKAFEHLFPSVDVPKLVGVSCCAQFAVTRDKIRERKKEDYIRYRDWLLETPLDDSISGRILEYSWHMIFGKAPVHCPSAKECYCKVFGLCELDCKDQASCEGRYTLPPFSSLPTGWPYYGWDGEDRNRSAPED